MATTPQALLLAHKWTTFFSAEPAFQYRAVLEVSFPNATTMHFKQTVLFSELGLGDDVVLEIDSPVTLSDAFFSVPATQSKTGSNPQGQTAKLQLTGKNYGFVSIWGAHQMAMLGRVYDIK